MHSRRHSAADDLCGTRGKKYSCPLAAYRRMQKRGARGSVAPLHAARPIAFQHFGRSVFLADCSILF